MFSEQSMKSSCVPPTLTLSVFCVLKRIFMETHVQVFLSFIFWLVYVNGMGSCRVIQPFLIELVCLQDLSMLLFFMLRWYMVVSVCCNAFNHLGSNYQERAGHFGGTQQTFRWFPLICFLKNKFLSARLSLMWAYWHRIELEVPSPRRCAQFLQQEGILFSF